MASVHYDRGTSGGTSLTPEQIVELQALYDQAVIDYRLNSYQVGLAASMYAKILEYIATAQHVPLNGHDQSVVNWLRGAVDVNQDIGSQATYIREYTREQYQARYGGSDANVTDEVTRASNLIGLNLTKDILDNNGSIPSIEGIAVIDAGAAASTVFVGSETPFGNYSPWAGTILMPFLGVDSFFLDWILESDEVSGTVHIDNDTKEFKAIGDGTYDLISILDAGWDAAISTWGSFPGGTLWQLAFGPDRATDTDQSNLVTQTNKYFNDYYDTRYFRELDVGDHLPFDLGVFDILGRRYTIGSYENDNLVLSSAPAANHSDVVHGGLGDDRIDGQIGDDLLDGGDGNDYLIGGYDNDFLWGGEGDDFLEGGKGDDIYVGGKGRDIYIVGEGTDLIQYSDHDDRTEDRLVFRTNLVTAINSLSADRIDVTGIPLLGGIGEEGFYRYYLTDGFAKFVRETSSHDGDWVRVEEAPLYSELGEAQILPHNGVIWSYDFGFDYYRFDATLFDSVELRSILDLKSDANSSDLIIEIETPILTDNEIRFVIIENFVEGDYGIRLFNGNGNYTQYEGMATDPIPEPGNPNAPEQVNYINNFGQYIDIPDIEADPEDHTGTPGDDVIRAGFGSDTIDALAGNDQVFAGFGDDRIAGGAGTDMYDGQAGVDTVDYSAQTAGVAANLATGNATGAGIDTETLLNIENIVGGAGNDSLTGDSGDNKLTGGAGDDVLNGLAGADTYVFGSGEGNDQVVEAAGAAGTDRLIFGDGLLFSALSAVRSANNPDDLVLSFNGHSGSLLIAGQLSSGANAGIEQFVFADGLVVEAGVIESLVDGNGAISGTGGDDQLDGTIGNDVINALAGGDTVNGLAGDDVVYGGAGNDTIDAGGGDDAVFAGAGADRIVGGLGNDSYDGQAGSDFIDYASTTAGVTVDLAAGTASGTEIGADTLARIEGIAGGTGADTLTGNDDGNYIDAGAGDDVIAGALGSDTYLYEQGDGNDRITEAGGGGSADRLVFGTGLASSALIAQRSDSVPDDVVLSFTGIAGSILLSGQLGIEDGSGIEVFEFADGTMLSKTDIETLATQSSLITGTAGADVLNGTAGADTIDALAGDDTVYAAGGADVLYGTVGNDVFELGGGNDTFIMKQGYGSDWLIDFQAGAGSDDRIDLRDFASINSLQDVLDVAYEVGGATWINLGNGDEIGLNSVAMASLHEDDFLFSVDQTARNVIDGTDSPENLNGTSGDDMINAKAGDDTVNAFSGDDIVFGSLGNDIITLGAGDDLFVVGVGDGSDWIVDFAAGALSDDKIDLQAFGSITNLPTLLGVASEAGSTLWIDLGDGDKIGLNSVAIADLHEDDFIFAPATNTVIEGTANADTLNGTVGNDTIDAKAGNDTVFAGDGDDLVYGRSGDDALDGETGADRIWGGSGRDNIAGGLGADEIHGGRDDDTIDGGAGYDFIDGGTGSDVIAGGDGKDKIFGGSGADNITGGNADDTIDGGSGADTIFGNSGADRIVGGDGSDTIDGGGGNDVIAGGSGRDNILGGAGKDTITGGKGRDTIDGGGSADVIVGGADNDVLRGGNGSDELDGGRGNDTIYGGNGDDTFVFSIGGGSDSIFDFVAGAGSDDVIDVSAFSQFKDLQDILGAAAQILPPDYVGPPPPEPIGITTVVALDNNSSITLFNVAAADLHADDFRFAV